MFPQRTGLAIFQQFEPRGFQDNPARRRTLAQAGGPLALSLVETEVRIVENEHGRRAGVAPGRCGRGGTFGPIHPQKLLHPPDPVLAFRVFGGRERGPNHIAVADGLIHGLPLRLGHIDRRMTVRRQLGAGAGDEAA